MSENKIENLIENVLNEEEKTTAFSDKFDALWNRVKEHLKAQKTDEALKEITFWALFLWTSDIHIDNTEENVVVRFRIDGILTDIFILEKQEYKILLERIKYSSWLKLNITNIPQDWKYSIEKDDKRLEIRVSTLPIKHWENVVWRILDSEKAVLEFKDLWFFWTAERIMKKALEKKNGLVLVTWPTGSWKTTSLYTMLSSLNTRDKKIITLEDPTEYELPWIIQAEVNPKDWFDYEKWIKALLRQDPDIIMIWEIRDFETLNTAASASLTWHLVLSTLHTKSATETLNRIINMWLKPYIMASALDTIVAQRLVKKICPHCKEEKEKTKNEKALIKKMLKDTWMEAVKEENTKLYHWKWCEHCNHTWYKWRIWVYEILSLNEPLRDMIREWATTPEIIDSARKYDFISMQEDWILKALKWHTTIEEIIRVI